MYINFLTGEDDLDSNTEVMETHLPSADIDRRWTSVDFMNSAGVFLLLHRAVVNVQNIPDEREKCKSFQESHHDKITQNILD